MRERRKLSHSFRAHRWRGAVAAFVLASLAACADWPTSNDVPDTGDLLRNSLPVAAAALAAGQLDVARRLYLSLSERFDRAPEPFLGLGYIAFQSGDSAAAEEFFLQASERAPDRTGAAGRGVARRRANCTPAWQSERGAAVLPRCPRIR